MEGCKVVKAGQDAKEAAVVDLVWAAGVPRATMPNVSIDFVNVRRYPADSELEKAVAWWMQPVVELEKATIARVPEPNQLLSSKNSRFGESSMASYLASTLRLCLGADALYQCRRCPR